MSDSGSQIIFKQLLDRHRCIQIPMIQRDFAQGRQSEKEVRVDFLNSLYNAFLLPFDDDALPLNLDFIYGSVEGRGETRFLPLDGQQRLTTLFLLHWYLALKDGCVQEFKKIFCSQDESRFSYSVRPSSGEFFNALVNFFPDTPPNKQSDLVALIANQSWYFRSWRLDPTIQSALTMLEDIHQRFSGTEASFLRLVDEAHPVITFQLLDLDNFGLSDDLYIKMNARGKPLTAFETFKARYEQALAVQFEGESVDLEERSVSVAEYFALRMDTRWADFFWSYRDKETHLFDNAVMNLFHAVALVTRDDEKDSYPEDVAALKDKELKFSYQRFQSNGWLDRSFSEVLVMLLDGWSEEGEFKLQLPGNRYFDERAIFAIAVSEPASLGYTEIVQFFGYVAFLREHGEKNAEAFQDWMRIVCNLSVNSAYERPADVQRSIAAVRNLVIHADNILEYFATTERPTVGFSPPQISEEILKAQLILANSGWRALIDKAESHGYFKGQIEFLLSFCGAVDSAEDLSVSDWSVAAHIRVQRQFKAYLKHAETMFNSRGLTSLDDYRWERALLSLGDYFLRSSDRNYSFLVNSAAEQGSWKRLLRTPDGGQRELLKALWDSLNAKGPVDQQLDNLIDAATDLEPWRQALIETPAAFGYCRQRALRWADEDEIYLLKKSRMSGAHAELYSYALHHRLTAVSIAKKLSPLRLGDYGSVSGSDFYPYVSLFFENSPNPLEVTVTSIDGQFQISLQSSEVAKFAKLNGTLNASLGFVKAEGEFQLNVKRELIDKTLLKLAGLLKHYK